jgi:urea transport system permease protein
MVITDTMSELKQIGRRFFLVLSLLLLLPFSGVWAADDVSVQDTAAFQRGLDQLVGGNFSQTSDAVALIGQSGDVRAANVLTLLYNGDLYLHKKDKVLVVITDKAGNNYTIRPLFAENDTVTTEINKRKIKKITINNQLRRELKSLLATINIDSFDPNSRRDAVTLLMGQMDENSYQRLEQRLAKESNSAVKDLIAVALAIYDLNSSDDTAVKTKAIEVLGESYQPTARNALTEFLASQPSSPLQQYAEKSLGLIEQRVNLAHFTETLFFGLSLGSVLVLAAIGLAITFGVMGIINMAHGELIMLGAYTTYVIQTLMPNHIGLSILVSIPAAFLVSAVVGIIIERTVIRFLYGRPLETLLATFGISLILQQAVRSVFSPLNRSVSTPEWMQGVIEVNPLLSLTLNRLYIIGFCLIVFALLFMLLRYTRLGIEVRAVSQNRSMARAMGVRSQWVDAMTFGLGSGIAGIAGVALSQLTNVGPNLGQAYIIDSFMVVVFGGVGNLWGTLVAGMSLGIANKIMEPWAGAVLAKILVLVFIILFIQKKPRGLFPQKGRSAEG